MSKDQLTTIAGAIAAIGLVLVSFIPQQADLIKQLTTAISGIALALLGYWTNKQ